MSMFKNKNQINYESQDIAHIIDCMDSFMQGDFSEVDVTKFYDQNLGQKYAQFIHTIVDKNNNYTMRLNDSMGTIGDNSCVKKMLDQVNSQSSSIEDLRVASSELGDSITNIQKSVETIRYNSHGVTTTSEECTRKIEESIRAVENSSSKILEINSQVEEFQNKTNDIKNIIDLVKKIAQKSGLLALNASIEAARAGEAGKGFNVVAMQIRDMSASTAKSAEDVTVNITDLMNEINELASSINNSARELQQGNQQVRESVNGLSDVTLKIENVTKEIDNISDEIHNQTELTNDFLSSVDMLSENYRALTEECVGTGTHLFLIGREIDRARSDMARQNSKIHDLDWLDVFEMDHLTFTWRVYNNAADFERLKITQLNNPKGCKLGKWAAAQTNPRILESKQFQNMIRLHELLHDYACKSWYAKDQGNVEEAMSYFQNTLETFDKLHVAIEDMKKYMHSIGITNRTDRVVFQM